MAEKEITGVVTAETCDCCGLHEIGIKTEDGRYIKLEPGAMDTIHVAEDQSKNFKKRAERYKKKLRAIPREN